MSAPAAAHASTTASGFEDGFGRRCVAFDREDGTILERLYLRPEFSIYERTLRDVSARLAATADLRIVAPSAIERDPDTGELIAVSPFVAGERLSDLLDAASEHARDNGAVPGIDVALGFLLDALGALDAMHAATGLSHGAVAPPRCALTPDGRVVLTESAFATVLPRLNLTRHRLWREFQIAAPPVAGAHRFDETADVSQTALGAVMLVLGRPAEGGDPTDFLPDWLAEVMEIAQIRGSVSFAVSLQRFLQRALPLPGRRPYQSVSAALGDVRQIAVTIGEEACRASLAEFVARAAGVAPEFVAPASLPVGRTDAVDAQAPDPPIRIAAATDESALWDSFALSDDERTASSVDSAPEPHPVPEPVWEPLETSEPALASDEPAAPIPEPIAPPPIRAAEPAAPSTVATVEPAAPSRTTKRRARSRKLLEDKLRSMVATFKRAEPPPPPEAVPDEISDQEREPEPEPDAAPARLHLVPPQPVREPEPVPIGLPPLPPPLPPLPPASLPPLTLTPRAPEFPIESIAAAAAPPVPEPPVPMPSFAPLPAAVADHKWVPDSWIAEPAAAPEPPSPALAPAAISLAAPPAPGGSPIRLKAKVAPPPQAPPPSYAEREFLAPIPRRHERESGRRIPWKMVAAGIVLVAAAAAARGYLPIGRKPLEGDVKKAAAPATVPAPAPAVATGTLVVDSQPTGASVLLDGAAAGKTPLRIVDVAPGRHVLTFVTPSATVRRTVKVEADKTITVDVPVFSGWIAIFAPIVLEVSEQGRLLGTTEQGRMLLPPGQHTLTLTNRDFGYSADQVVEIEAGEVKSLNVQPMGSANLNAEPWAEVWIDGKKAGETPIANYQLPLGNREIIFRHPEFGERKVMVRITANAPAAATVDFSR